MEFEKEIFMRITELKILSDGDVVDKVEDNAYVFYSVNVVA
jgi:hypothetical protein